MKLRTLFSAFLLFIGHLPAYDTANLAVHYELAFPNAVHHEAEVKITFSGVTQPVLEVVMSQSSPGRYALHEFAKNVYKFRAVNGKGKELQVVRPNPSQWNVEATHSEGRVIVSYTLFGDRTDGTYAAIDETHAHLNMPAALAWAHGYEHAPATLVFNVPANSNWKAATQLHPTSDGYSAPDLEWMMDSPIELSAQTMREWKVGDALFRMALHHRGTEAEADDYAALCKRVVAEEEGVFGVFPNFDGGSYTFLLDYLPYDNSDGMEHRDSTVISGALTLKESAHRAIGTVSHEFFHAWNVRRIRPKSLEPFDFEHVDMSGELWFAEGFTNYYGLLALKRAGISTLDEFVGGMSGAVDAVITRPGREVFSAVEMSERAPFVDAATSIDPTNNGNIFISYYTYGQALAFGIDLAIRQRFPGKSLDDWMRAMWRAHPDIDKPYTLTDLEKTLASATGDKDFAKEIFERHIGGKDPLDYGRLVKAAGLTLRLAHPGKAWLGPQRLDAGGSGVQLATPSLRGSPLYSAGLEKGDEISECEGKAVKTVDQLEVCVAHKHPGDHLVLKATTRAGVRQAEVLVGEDPKVEIVTNEAAGVSVTPEMKALREQLFGSKAIHPLINPPGL